MKVSLNWLKRYVDLPKDLTPSELALRLTMATVEVEEFEDLGAGFDQIVVGQIKEIVPHPDADKLRVCQVDVGEQQRRTIVCGGSNLETGMFCVVALPGARVRWHGQGEAVELGEAKIRGVASAGMICAASEVGLEDFYPATSETEIVNLGNNDWVVGQSLAQALGFADIVFTIDNKSITNRPDLWGHYGLAREIAAIFNLKLKPLEIKEIKAKKKVGLKVKLEDKKSCQRYLAAAVQGVQIVPSPLWLQRLLQACGVRPINNIVDLTNFVTLELGQPSHAFDRRFVAGDQIIVRLAKDGEEFVTLDGESRKLTANDCLICDAERPVALAGVMGGLNSEVKDDSTELIFEMANFTPAMIRRTANRLALRTEAAIRFEKGISPSLAELGMRRLLSLVLELVPTAVVASPIVDKNNYDLTPKTITLDPNWLNKRLGVSLEVKEVTDILTRLEFGVENKSGELIITVPDFRGYKDINIPEDIIEEVARIYGYDRIPEELPEIKLSNVGLDPEKLWERKARQILSAVFGLNEIYNYSWQEEKYLRLAGLKTTDCLQLQNYLAPEQQYLRPSLVPNLFKNVTDNLRWYKHLGIFEIGRVFVNKPGKFAAGPEAKEVLPSQSKSLAWLLAADSEDLFYRLKGQVEYLGQELGVDFVYETVKEHPYLTAEKCLAIYQQRELLGYLGVVKESVAKQLAGRLSIAVVDLDFSALVKYLTDKKVYQSLPRYPVVLKDFSIIMAGSVSWQEIEASLLAVSNLVRQVEVFDRYYDRQQNQFSIAFHIRLYDPTKTLTASEIGQVTDKIQDLLEKKYNLTIKKQ